LRQLTIPLRHRCRVHNTYFWIDLKKRITAVALMQILPVGDPDVQGTMIAFERALYAARSSIARA
jgi:hypothetical protein